MNLIECTSFTIFGKDGKMKKTTKAILLFAFAGAFLSGCAGTKSQPAPRLDAPGFDAAKYDAKVENFIVVLDASSSMDGKYNRIKKFDTAKSLMDGLNQSLPELGYKGLLRDLGPDDGTGRETDLLYGPAVYSTSDFARALDSTPGPAGNTPLGKAIDYAFGDLADSGNPGGKTAVIIVSDGKEPSDDPAASVRQIKSEYPNTCFYTLLIGDDESGQALMNQIAEIGECGFSKRADDVYNTAAMAAFVEEIFLAEKPAPIRKVQAPAAPGPCPDQDGDGVCDRDDRCPNTPAGATVDQFGCWAFGSLVLFDFDKSVVKPEAYPMLNEVVEIIRENPGLHAILEGHTDSVGTNAYNQKLSERRADAVMQYVLQRGIPADRLSSTGYGETKPRATNDTEEGRALNRRVEITPKNQ